MRTMARSVLAGVAPLLWVATAQAAYDFSSTGNCTVSAGQDNTLTCSSPGTATSPEVKLQVWANTVGDTPQNGAGGGLAQAYVKQWSGVGAYNDDFARPGDGSTVDGFGGTASSASDKDLAEKPAPEHTIDNNGRFEMAFLDFGSYEAALSSVTFGYVDNDADFSVLAYTGAAPFTGFDSTMTWGTIGSGWEVIGNYDANTTGTYSINAGGTKSSYWLIGAYNPIFGSSATNGGVVDHGETTTKTCSWWGCSYKTVYQYDYFKLAAIAGSFSVPPPSSTPGVPEPGSLALAGIAAFGLWRTRRRSVS